MRLLFLIIGVIFLALPVQAQKRTLTGYVYSGAHEAPLSNVHVRSGKWSTKTDRDGRFELEVLLDEELIFTHSKHYIQYIPYKRLFLEENPKFYLTPTSDVGAKILTSNEVQKVHTPDFEHIFDYEFLNDTLIVLSYMNWKENENKEAKPYVNCALTAMRFGEVFERIILPDYSQYLFLDYTGQLFLLGEESCHMLNKKPPKLSISPFDRTLFLDRIQPIYGKSGNNIFFTYYTSYIPFQIHKVHSLQSQESRIMRNIKNEAYFAKVEDDYDMLNDGERRMAEDLEKETGLNRKLFSTYLRSFYILRDVRRPYAPGFMIDNKPVIVSHMNSYLFKFNQMGDLMDSVAVYHSSIGKEELIKIVQDPYSAKLYTVHDKSGVRYIRELNLETGGTGFPFKIHHPFAEQIKIYEGYVYYLHKTPLDKNNQHLLREKLPFSFSYSSP